MTRTSATHKGSPAVTISLALSVQQIRGIAWIDKSSIQPPSDQISHLLQPCLQGCVFQDSIALPILNAEAVVNAAILRN
jgi:chemotaxis signal transduction protein